MKLIMLYWKLILVLCLSSISLKAQIETKDLNTNAPISNVKLFSKEGKIIGISNLKGEIKISKKVHLQRTDSVEVFHSSYYSKKALWEEITNTSLILMEPDPVTKLDEVILSAEKPEYLLLKGNFVSYQIIDDVPLVFTDGIIEYYINLKKNKLVKSKILKSRIFRNQESIKSFSEEKGNSTRNILSTLPPFNFNQEVLVSNWEKFDVSDNGIIKRGDSVIGNQKKDESNTVLSIQYYSPENPKKISLFGIKSTINNEIITENFDATSAELESITSVNRYYNSDLARKDITIHYELVENFYTTESKILSKENFQNQLKKTVNPQNYLVEDEVSYEIPSFIKSLLFDQLVLVDK